MLRPPKARIRLRLATALLAARAASALTRALRRGGGTVIPGHVAARLYPGALHELANQLPAGAVLISGTNGKTTTARTLSAIARHASLEPIHNRAGANLPAGILSALVNGSDLHGALRGQIGVFEVDEAHVPAVVAAMSPRVLLLTNLFRDQLDRYGEIDLVARRWRETAQAGGPDLTLVANVDDPALAHLVGHRDGPTLSFGVEDHSVGGDLLDREADRRLCPACGGRLHYDWCFYGHLGHYACENCGWRRPRPSLAMSNISTESDRPTRAELEYGDERAAINLALPGLHNLYNAMAAIAAALALGVNLHQAVAGLDEGQGAFGRYQRIEVGAGSLTLVLAKNPVGFNQALRSAPDRLDRAMIAINDLFADGTDVSWLWDVDFSALAQRQVPLTCTGLRAPDMAVRLKYDGASDISLEPELASAVREAVAAARDGANITFFSTYTATLEIQRLLTRQGLIPAFWEG